MRLIFVRHGEPDYAHDCLTENGVVQAKCTAGRLRDESFCSGGSGGDPCNRMVIPRLELFNDMGHIESIKHERLHFDK